MGERIQSRRILYSRVEVAEMCGVSTKTIKRWVQKGILPEIPETRMIPATAVRRHVGSAVYVDPIEE